MASKFVRLDENQRVLEKYQVAGTQETALEKFKEEITKKYHADYADYFIQIPDSHAPELGQQWTGSEFIEYVFPPEVIQRRTNEKAGIEIERLHLLALREVVKIIKSRNLETPELQAIIDAIQIEKGKII